MTQPITNIDDAYEFFYDSGRIIMRLKPHITNKIPLTPKLESLKILISQNHPKTNEQKNESATRNGSLY